MIKEEILDLDEFMALARASHPDWKSEDDPQKCGWVFRGQKYCGADGVEWKLLPSAWRPATMEPYLDKLRGRTSSNGYEIESNEYKLELYHQAYYLLMRDFGELSVSIGFEGDWRFDELTTNVYRDEYENRRLRNFNTFGFQEFEVVQNAQHYGIPTHLLDWSYSPLVAVHHAIGDSPVDGGDTQIVLWCLNTCDSRFFKNFGLDVVTPKKAINPFLTAQKGLFTVLHSIELPRPLGFVHSADYFLEHGEWPSLEYWYENHCFQDETQRPHLRKLILKAKDVPEARQRLRREGISSAHLKPTLENVAKVVMGDLGYREKKCKCKGTNS